ncbi:unnamed protein product [Lampetra fluviatilis]
MMNERGGDASGLERCGKGDMGDRPRRRVESEERAGSACAAGELLLLLLPLQNARGAQKAPRELRSAQRNTRKRIAGMAGTLRVASPAADS